MSPLRSKLYTIFLLFSIFFITSVNIGSAEDFDKDKTIKRAQQYFNNLHSIEAAFRQVDSNNEVRDGRFYLSRPNKLRLDYDTPQKEMVMLSEDMFIHYNEELKEVSYLTANQVPISFLSRKNLDLNKDTKILNVSQAGNLLNLEIELPSKDEYKPRLTLGFERSPFNLKTILIQEPSGNTVNLELKSAKYNSEIDSKVFEFKNPKFFG